MTPRNAAEAVRGVAASAFDTGAPDAVGILSRLLPHADPAETRRQVEACRAEPASRPASQDRISALRSELAARGLNGFLVPVADEYGGEFIPPHARRLSWLTGFTGSAGLAVVLADKAAIFVDGRYALQVESEVDTETLEPRRLTRSSPAEWLKDHGEGRIGFDPWLHAPNDLRQLDAVAAELVPLDVNPVDATWADQPPRPLGPIRPHDLRYSGRGGEEKRREVARTVVEAGCDAAVLEKPASIAWLLNVRGSDVAFAPLPLSRAVLRGDGAVEWFVDERKLVGDLRDRLDGVSVLEPGAFPERVDALGGSRVLLDPESASVWVDTRLRSAGAKISEGDDPCLLPKARKNRVELDGARACHVRDGAALCEFLAWLSRAGPTGTVTERSAADRLLRFREAGDVFRGASFETISGSGPNGAIVHYRVTAESDRTLRPGDLYLVDSGGQYLDGTTDVTRTVLVPGGEVSPEAKDRFTRVLKGHIAIASARFPAGTSGGQLDALARTSLWQAGLDYDHGTGHGVGSYLEVHEGPQRIAAKSGDAPLEPGMILSNEPGYYEPNAYGIRTENLVIVRESEGGMLNFETITLAPVDLALVEPSLLAPDERSWLNAYHSRVRKTLAPLLSDSARRWLDAAAASI